MNLQHTLRTLWDSPACEWGYSLKRKFLRSHALPQFDAAHPCVFVLSTGRVGTKTFAALCSLSSSMMAIHEPRPLLYGLSRTAYELREEQGVNHVLKQAFLSLRDNMIKRALFNRQGYIETSPQATFLAPAILQAVPDVRFIHLVRDPRKVIRSGMRRQWYAGHGADINRIVPSMDSEYGKQWDQMSVFGKNTWLWTETNRWILQFTDSLPKEQFVRIRSEDIFNGDEQALKSVFKLLGSALPRQNKIEKVIGTKLNAQKKGYFPNDNEWTDELNDELNEVAGDLMKKLAY